jgi:putative hydrolase of the HAD superfamily
MPGSIELLAALRRSLFPMGIVSNAQVFTPPLVEDLVDSKNLELGGFDLNLCFFSNRFRQSKPGPRLFDALRDALSRRGILPYEAVYVGNDMLNDIWAASQAGLRTAWFAGDARSLRARDDDPRCLSLRPDVVLTNLLQLLECLRVK